MAVGNECSGLKIIDPVDGLLEYINDIKPFHTKVVNVLVEYSYTELSDTSFNENLEIDFGDVNYFQFMLIEANSTTNEFTVSGDVTGNIQNGDSFRVVGTSNSGIYTAVSTPVYNLSSNRSTILVSTISNDDLGGWIEYV